MDVERARKIATGQEDISRLKCADAKALLKDAAENVVTYHDQAKLDAQKVRDIPEDIKNAIKLRRLAEQDACPTRHRALFQRLADSITNVPARAKPADTVSTITLTHRRPMYLIECLTSITKQTRKPDEIIVVANSCTGLTGAAFDQVKNTTDIPMKLVECDYGRDKSTSKNEGFAASHGNRCVFIDDDDTIGTGFIGCQLDALRKARPNVGFAYPRINEWKPETGETKLMASSMIPFTYGGLTRANYVSNSSMFKREAFEDVGGYEPGFKRYEDWRLWLRMAQQGWTGVPCQANLWQRVHATQAHTLLNKQKAVNDVAGYHSCQAEVLRTHIFTPFARFGEPQHTVLASIARVLKAHEKFRWVVYDNTATQEESDELLREIHLKGLALRTTYYRDPRPPVLSETGRNVECDALGLKMAQIWNWALFNIPADLILSIEDDMDVPPDIFERLVDALYADTLIVGAAYRRGVRPHRDGGQEKVWVCYELGGPPLRAKHIDAEKRPYHNAFDVGLVGFGAALVRAPCFRDMGINVSRIENVMGGWPAADTMLAWFTHKAGYKVKAVLLENRPMHFHEGEWQ